MQKLNKELIIKDLTDNPLITIKNLADKHKVCKNTLYKFLKSNKIKYLTEAEKLKIRNKLFFTVLPINISENMNQIILGSLLGDGSVVRKNTNCFLEINHSKVQILYAKYKYGLIKKEGIKVKFRSNKGRESIIEGRSIKNNGNIRVETCTNISFNKYREQWYKERKIVPNSVYELRDLGLAIWFMDDGTSNKSSFYLSTQGFNMESLLTLVDMMKKNFNIDCSIHKQKYKHVLYIKANSRENFIKIISPFICKSMSYKLNHWSL